MKLADLTPGRGAEASVGGQGGAEALPAASTPGLANGCLLFIVGLNSCGGLHDHGEKYL